MKKTYLVVGLGRFGSAVAQRLYELGSEVMAVDLHPELVQKMESKVTARPSATRGMKTRCARSVRAIMTAPSSPLAAIWPPASWRR